MATEAQHAHESSEVRLPPVAWGLVAVVGLVVVAAWIVTWRTADAFDALMMAQLSGAAPVDTLAFVGLSGVMMVAMMLPSALPMVATYRGLSERDAGAAEARVRTFLFTSGYIVVWGLFTALALVVLVGFGALGGAGPWGAYVPGALLLAAGVYQFSSWKRFCLNHCRSPMQFVMSHWRSGRGAAFRMGLDHAAYCLGCCWLLMLVLFTAGAMSVLWMGVFASLVLVEKVWSRGPAFGRAMGMVAMAAGLTALGLTWSGAPDAFEGMDGMAG